MKSYHQLYEYDMFGYTVRLYFNGNTKEGTLFGLIITLVYILSFIGVIIYYITETFSRKNFTLSTSTIEYENAVSIILDKEIFALNFALQDPLTYADYIDETIYYINVNLITGIRDPKTLDFIWNYEKIKTGPCSLDMFAENNQHFFKIGYKNKYCLYDINKKNLTGNFVFDYYSRIVVSFYPCINSTENNNHCKSKNIIDYYLNNTYVGIYLQSVTIDEKQIPMTKNYIESPFTTVGQNFYRDYQIFFKIVETEDDNDIVFKTKKFKRLLQLDYTKEMSSINHKVNDNSFCDITIKLSDKKTIYKRSNEKLTNALYKAGGIMPVIYYMIKICLWIPVKIVYEINAINKVFKFDMTKTIRKINERNRSKIKFNINKNPPKSKKEVKENSFDLLKMRNDENIKNNSKVISNQEFVYLNKNSDLNLKKQNIKDIQSDNGPDSKYNKNITKNNFLTKNIINQKNQGNNSSFNNLRVNVEKEIIDNNKNINKQKDIKYIVDMVKINWYQFLCYYPLKQCSNNIKIDLIENGRKFYKQNLDIINVFKNIIMWKKLYEYFLTNKKIFGLSDNNNISYYDKPIISD